MKRYSPKQIEPKWQQIWEETGLYKVREDAKQKKYYELEYFPYPSGATMHVGHVRNYAISDVWARFQRMQGYNVLHPMGWDSFGLPAENFAIKTGTPPRTTTDENIKTFKRQLQQMGFSYDWSREVDSSSPEYYRWTQWCFLLLYKLGLAYRASGLQNWCPKDQTVLANEQVLNDGTCERCGTKVEKKELKQWYFKITNYADRLISDLDEVDWPENIKQMQRNWIGKSEGIDIDFALEDSDEKITTFTKYPETIFGVTYLVVAPEYRLVGELTTSEQKAKVVKYLAAAANKTEFKRLAAEKEKTGVFTGSYAINPVNGERIPVWIADYVLPHFGTGAVMGVPAHDERDFVFAQKYALPMKRVVGKAKEDNRPIESLDDVIEDGVLINSGELDGLKAHEPANLEAIKWLDKKGFGKPQTNYRLRDWLISRQRYWGAPIPIIHCPKDGDVAVPEDQLPVVLPEVESYQPSGDGRSPLARVESFVKTACPQCGGPAERETDTMDGFACSSWYFLRFTDAHNTKAAWSKEKANYWMPVDTYVGGAEHAVMHLLYARFWTKVFYDEGLVNVSEPFKSLRNQGMIGGADGRKMGKRYGNAVTPDELIEKGYGADAIRLFELFIAPYNQDVDWSVNGVDGTLRFLNRVWTLAQNFLADKNYSSSENVSELETELLTAAHKTIAKITKDAKGFSLNTAIAALMEYVNELYKIQPRLSFHAARETWLTALDILVLLLAPFAPHITEELWRDLGHSDSVHLEPWPVADEKYLQKDLVIIVVQVNGKVRANIEMPADVSKEEMVQQAKADQKVESYLRGKKLVKTVTVPQKLVNFVIL